MSKEEKFIKVVIAGDGGVGKSTLVKRYIEGKYIPQTLTPGITFEVKRVPYGDDTVVLTIADVGGENQFRFMLPMWIKGSELLLLTFDTTRYKSFLNLKTWLEEIRKLPHNVPIILVGTKVDETDKRSVSKDEALAFARKEGLLTYIEVSAKTGENINELFNYVIMLLLNWIIR